MMGQELGLLLVAGLVAGAAGAVEPPLLGAIRWDAWHVPTAPPEQGLAGGPVRAMERSLGPQRYQWRLPFFGEVLSPETVRIPGYSQAIVDQEIGFAKAGGLDYWAFLLYDPASPMSQGLALYRSSARRQEVRFCAIASPPTFGNAQAFDAGTRRIVELVGEPGYVTVAGGRPLLYLFDVRDAWLAAWGGESNARRLFDGLRAAVQAAGHGDPYLVILDFQAARGRRLADLLGAQAISSYARSDGRRTGAPYAELARFAHGFWDECARTGAQVVPLAMAGWDRRPRVEHPVPWEKNQQPGVGLDRYYETPTPTELADHLADALTWAAVDPARCPAQAVLTYAWNEHDEGGWLCPTRGADGQPDASRLEAIAAMRRAWTPPAGR